ncbi:MAG: hypothetical protein POELPBGB_02212 [Bacteroidia bacterium]|nr:hypothetical protein [Bacteroidia bacterium]
MILIIGRIMEIGPVEVNTINNKPINRKTIIVNPLENPLTTVAINIWGSNVEKMIFEVNTTYIFNCKVTSKKGEKGWFTNITLLSALTIVDFYKNAETVIELIEPTSSEFIEHEDGPPEGAIQGKVNIRELIKTKQGTQEENPLNINE